MLARTRSAARGSLRVAASAPHPASAMALIAVLSFAAGCDQRSAPSENPATSKPAVAVPVAVSPVTATPATQPAASIPQVDLQRLREQISKAAAEGKKAIVIDFWATWCAPCVEMFPQFHDRLGALGPDVKLISVTLDTPGPLEQVAVDFLRQHQALEGAFMLSPDTDTRLEVVHGLAKKWNDLVVPAILIFNKDGNLAGEFVDNVQVEPVVTRVEELLAQSKGHP